jgi:hypothetical protein
MRKRKTIDFPLFHIGKYKSASGSEVDFTDALLRQLEKNTNFVLRSKVLQAPIGYDHPAAGSDSHGIITGARYANGVLYVTTENHSDKLASDAKAFRRLTYSGEFEPEFKYTEKGREVKVGPTVVGLAILGKQRAAIKNPEMIPLAAFEFGEGVEAADAFSAREELHSSGVVSEHYDGKHFFAEVENDSRRFFEEEKDMDKEEIQALIDKATAPLKADNERLRQDLANSTVDAKRVGDVAAFCETIKEDKKLSKIPLTKLDAILMHAKVAGDKELDTMIRSFAESLSPFVVSGGVASSRATTKTKDDDDDAGHVDEPDAVALLAPKHFSDDSGRSEKFVAAGIVAFGEWQPDKMKGKSTVEKIDVVRRYVAERDGASS